MLQIKVLKKDKTVKTTAIVSSHTLDKHFATTDIRSRNRAYVTEQRRKRAAVKRARTIARKKEAIEKSEVKASEVSAPIIEETSPQFVRWIRQADVLPFAN